MIDKQQFDNTFQYFDPEDVVDIIDMFIEQYPSLIQSLSQNIEDHDLVQVKWNAHKIKGICRQFFDPVSSEDARKMEDTANEKIMEIVDVMLAGFPELLHKLRLDFNEGQLYLEIVKVHSIFNYVSGLTGSLSADDARKLTALEESKTKSDILRLFPALESSSASLYEELKNKKKEFIH